MPPRGDGGALTADLEARRRAVELIGCAAALLFANGQTTERTVQAVERLGRALGVSVTLLPRWDVLTLEIGEGVQSRSLSLASAPTGVDMGKVAIVLALIEQLCDGRLGAEAAAAALDQVKHAPPTSTIRFAIMAAAGAMALGVIFGAVHLLSLALIGISAGLGGWLRRALGRFSRNPFLQPFSAALLAGLLGAATAQLQLSSLQRLIAVCPCMVLVPGPHLLNGAIDLVRARIALGAARMA
ncbi:MAG: threonine/serine exporter family protein, partial [Caulobacteraceae bacterium]